MIKTLGETSSKNLYRLATAGTRFQITFVDANGEVTETKSRASAPRVVMGTIDLFEAAL